MYRKPTNLNASKSIVILILSFILFSANAQDTEELDLEDLGFLNYVTKTFYATSLINTQTSELVPKGQLKFTIKHRFGLADLNEDFLKNFMGLDLSSNIRFGFQVPVSDRFYVGIGRTKEKKQYDLEGKIALIRQTLDNKTPLNISVYADVAVSADDFPKKLDAYDYFMSDSTTVFNYHFNHRLSYNSQIIFSRKFNSWFSAQVAPQLTYRNLVRADQENLLFAVPLGLRFKVALLSSVIFDFTPVFTNKGDFGHPWGIGYEVGTAGHSFQFFIGNTSFIMNPYMYSNETSKLLDNQFYLGFNIHRYLWLNN